MTSFDKGALVGELRAQLTREIDVAANAARGAREAATHEDAKPENDKDTRAIEAGYLAGAQAERVVALRTALASLEAMPLRVFAPGDPIALGAVVELDFDGARSHYFIVPLAGGLRAAITGLALQTITPPSPMGQALIGKSVGDGVEVRTKQGVREYEIVAIW